MTLDESRQINEALTVAAKQLTISGKAYYAELLTELKDSIEDEVGIRLDKIKANWTPDESTELDETDSSDELTEE